MSNTAKAREFDQVNDRLKEIHQLVADPDTPLDEVIRLYEEAIDLGLAACDLSEIEEAEPVSGDAMIEQFG